MSEPIESLNAQARQLLQELVSKGGWAYCGDYGECIFCGAYEGDSGASSKYHRTGCIIERAKELAKKMLEEESKEII
jgi:hypothetical protein